MILKIERYTDDQHWWIVDNIRKVSISNVLYRRSGCWENADITIFDMPKVGCTCSGDNERCSECREYLRIIFKLSDGTEKCVFFDTIAYLLNDEGKTIEKIVANYKEQ